MKRTYTPAQVAARLAYTREWRKRNKAKIDAWESANRLRRNRRRLKLARARRETEAARHRANYRKHRQMRREASRAYRRKRIAANPNFYRERNREWALRNPTYASEIYHRRTLRLSMHKFASVLAANRGAA